MANRTKSGTATPRGDLPASITPNVRALGTGATFLAGAARTADAGP
ncbi:MAG TPA: hypothetical protein VLH58_00745 [Candidatus Methylomirabilis sp.]|nr:hypothetical protein [Candidatus Methylomirabilis sp.]HSC69848.1 hypothetical protein [Candidatus Methylomirabilis sp.]